MTQPETPDVEDTTPDPAPDDELALMETTNYAHAFADYRPPADHATEPDQVDALPGETSLHVPAKPAEPGEAE